MKIKKKQVALSEVERQMQEAELSAAQEAEFFDEHDAHLDEQAFIQLNNSYPAYMSTVTRMIEFGISSEKIKRHMQDKYRYLWIQTQTLMAAIRHLESLQDE